MHNLRHLKYVVEAARHGSITKASKVLLVSQPAISAAVKACEEEFGIRIFVRNPSQGLSLTPSGRTFVKHARELLDEAKEFEQVFDDSVDGTLEGRLELACYASPAPLLLPPVIRSFVSKNPDVEIGLHEGDMEQVSAFLKDGTADLALTYDIFLDNDLDFEIIAPLKPFVMMSAKNPLAKRKSLSLAELAEEPMILLDSPGFREFFQNYFGMHGLQPHVRYRPTTYEMVRGLLASGLGYALALVKIKNGQAYDNSPLANVELSEAPPRVHLVMANLKGYRQSRIAREFAEECRTLLSRIETGAPLG